MKKELVLFLDFDGDLHHFFQVKEATNDENALFYYVLASNNFVKILNQHFDV